MKVNLHTCNNALNDGSSVRTEDCFLQIATIAKLDEQISFATRLKNVEFTHAAMEDVTIGRFGEKF